MQAELTMVDEQLQQARQLAEQDRRHIKEQTIREDELLRRIDQLEDELTYARAETEDARAVATMEKASAAELREALGAAERHNSATQEDYEATLRACNEQRRAEAQAHAERIKGWKKKLDDFSEAATTAVMDIRVYVNNEPVFRALMDGLRKEEEMLQKMELQTSRAEVKQETERLAVLNGRISSLERAVEECKVAQNKAKQEILALGSHGYERQLADLRRQLAEQGEQVEHGQALVAQRERWADEQVEIEKRLFAEALQRVQAEHMVRQREALQGVVSMRARSVLVLERNHAIRELLGKRGRLAWVRRILDAVWREWKSQYIRGRQQRAAADHQLQLRQRVERAMREERQQHGAQLASLGDATEALRRELEAAQQRAAADARRREREDALRIEALQRQAAQNLAVAQRHIQARLVEVEMAHEERERVEAELGRARAAARLAEQQADARARKAQAEWEVRLEEIGREREALKQKAGASSVADTLAKVHATRNEAERSQLLRRAERAETGAVAQQKAAEVQRREERERAERQLAALRRQVAASEARAADAAAALEQERIDVREERRAEAARAAAQAEALQDEVRVARVAADLHAKDKRAELDLAHAELKKLKTGMAWRLDKRWAFMLLRSCWQAWCRLRSEALLQKFEGGGKLVRTGRRRTTTQTTPAAAAAPAALAAAEEELERKLSSGRQSSSPAGSGRRSLSTLKRSLSKTMSNSSGDEASRRPTLSNILRAPSGGSSGAVGRKPSLRRPGLLGLLPSSDESGGEGGSKRLFSLVERRRGLSGAFGRGGSVNGGVKAQEPELSVAPAKVEPAPAPAAPTPVGSGTAETVRADSGRPSSDGSGRRRRRRRRREKEDYDASYYDASYYDGADSEEEEHAYYEYSYSYAEDTALSKGKPSRTSSADIMQLVGDLETQLQQIRSNANASREASPR